MLERSGTGHRLKQRRERQRRYKQRQRRGVVIWPVEVDGPRFTKLVALGYLRPNATDAREGGLAIAALLDNIET